MMLPISPSAMVCMEQNRASLIVLVAEDETLIGMAMEDALRQAGYTVAGVFAASSAALEWLENGRADAAVLDFSLRDGDCVQLLRELRSREVPILMHSAFTKLPDEFRELPRILKPGTLTNSSMHSTSCCSVNTSRAVPQHPRAAPGLSTAHPDTSLQSLAQPA